MNITVDTTAIEEFHHRFSKFQEEVPRELKRVTKEATEDLKKQVPPYPPKRPHQTYVRTGKLGRSIKAQVDTEGTRVIGRLYSQGVPYAPYVITEGKRPDGRTGQAWMHKGRWWTLQEVLSGNISRVMSYYNGMFDRLWKKVYSGHRKYL